MSLSRSPETHRFSASCSAVPQAAKNQQWVLTPAAAALKGPGLSERHGLQLKGTGFSPYIKPSIPDPGL
jgi:hypothetical protein